MTWNKILEKFLGVTTFKPGQKEALLALEKGEDTLALLPTGGGKSLIYQLFQYGRGGTTVIVSPLLALIEDQLYQLQKLGLKRVLALTSQYRPAEREPFLEHLGQYQFILLSPEMLMQPEVLRALQKITLRLFVVDEAHCISQWGLNFRPEYLRLQEALANLNWPLILAVSATANERVMADVNRHLFPPGRKRAVIQVPLDRPKLFYDRKIVPAAWKAAYLKAYLEHLPKPGIVYVHQKEELAALVAWLKAETSLRVTGYHGDLSSADRLAVQEQFQAGYLDVILATSAFGMGINQGNVRFVLHYHAPKTLAEYSQETGRAGRNGQFAYCLLLLDEDEEGRLSYFKHASLLTLAEFTSHLEALASYPLGKQQQFLQDLPADVNHTLSYYLKAYSTNTERQAAYQHFLAQEQGAIGEMQAYLQDEKCLRKTLLAHFGQEPPWERGLCCCYCSPDFSKSSTWQCYLTQPSPKRSWQNSAIDRLQQLLGQK